MITARTIVGSREQIAEKIGRMGEDVVEAIVFVNERNGDAAPEGSIFAEMAGMEVSVDDVDYSRESIYAPPEGE